MARKGACNRVSVHETECAEIVVRKASKRDAEAQEWMRMLPELGEILRVQV